MDKILVIVIALVVVLFLIVAVTGAIVMYNAIHETFDVLTSVLITSFILLVIIVFMIGLIGGILV